jgi:sulfur-oxidizing protein SoxZ
MANALINAPKTAKRGDTIEIKALILHPMETGFRPGTNGRIIPRNIIEHFSARWNGEEIFAMTFSPAIAANPFVSFFTMARDSGKIDFLWTGDEDFRVEESVSIVVT